jgi:UDP-glucose-4-epimerase GalE
MNVLVAGGAGYIGSVAVRALAAAGHHPVALDNLSRGFRDAVSCPLVAADLGDAATVSQVLRAHRIEAVMHFAAYAYVGESVEKPAMYYHNNFAATCTLLEEMIKAGVLRFIFSSTAAVYGNPSRVPIPEDHPTAPINPYGRSKRMVEEMLEDLAAAHGLRYASLRYFNAAGASRDAALGERHDPETHLIPLCLEAAYGRRDHLAVFGTDYPTADGTCIRDYIHVEDLASAHLLALQALDRGNQTLNVGTGRGYSVREVIAAVEQVTGRKVPVRESARRPGDPPELVAQSERIRRELGWMPHYESLESIVETADRWFRKWKGI